MRLTFQLLHTSINRIAFCALEMTGCESVVFDSDLSWSQGLVLILDCLFDFAVEGDAKCTDFAQEC